MSFYDMSGKCHYWDKSSDKLNSVQGLCAIFPCCKEGGCLLAIRQTSASAYLVFYCGEVIRNVSFDPETQELTLILISQCELHKIPISENRT